MWCSSVFSVSIHQVNKTMYRQSAQYWNSHGIIQTVPLLIPKIATLTLFSVRWTLTEGVENFHEGSFSIRWSFSSHINYLFSPSIWHVQILLPGVDWRLMKVKCHRDVKPLERRPTEPTTVGPDEWYLRNSIEIKNVAYLIMEFCSLEHVIMYQLTIPLPAGCPSLKIFLTSNVLM